MGKWVVTVAVMLTPIAGGRARDARPPAGKVPLEPSEAERLALRRTPLVRVFEACRDSVVTLAIRRTRTLASSQPTSKPRRVTRTQWGSGFVLHEKGFLLTNSHALRLNGKRELTFRNGRRYAFGVVAADRGNDLAVIKIDPKHPLKPLRLARNGDVMVGERVAAIGNPFGMGLTMSAGIVTAVGRATQTEYTTLTDMIQTDASINPGSSGGPLLNVLGEVVGIVTSHKEEGQGIAFATPIDKVRDLLPKLLSPEKRYGFVLGIRVPDKGRCTVAGVADGSPAHNAGVKVGDLLVGVADYPIRTTLDFHLSLVEREPGEAMDLKFLRKGKLLERTVMLGRAKLREAIEARKLKPGLRWTAYKGQWGRVPDFRSLKPAASGTAPTFSLGRHGGGDHFALEFTGYVRVPKDGVYLFYTRSDDGSRLYIGDDLVVDNDGLHSALEKGGFAALKAGLHPIRVGYFEAAGEVEVLEVYYEGRGLDKQPIPAKALFHRVGPATRLRPRPRAPRRARR